MWSNRSKIQDVFNSSLIIHEKSSMLMPIVSKDSLRKAANRLQTAFRGFKVALEGLKHASQVGNTFMYPQKVEISSLE